MSEQTNLIPVNDPSEIPENLSDEEELEFWDTHYMTEAYLSKMEEAPEEERPQARSYSKQVNVRMDESTVERLKDLAEARGVGYQTLMKDFIKERLYEEEIREGTVSRANSPASKTVFNVPTFPRAFPSPPTFNFFSPQMFRNFGSLPSSSACSELLQNLREAAIGGLGSTGERYFNEVSNTYIDALKVAKALNKPSRQIGNLGDVTIIKKHENR